MSSPPITPSSPNAPRGKRIRLPAAPAYTGLSLKTLRRLIDNGTLRAYKVVGIRAVMVDTDDLDALMIPTNGHGEA